MATAKMKHFCHQSLVKHRHPSTQESETSSIIHISRFILLCGIILLILPGRGVAASPTGPIETTPARVALAAYLTAYNSGDAKLLRAFQDLYGFEVRIEVFKKLRADSGELVLQRIKLDEPLHIEVLLKESNTGRRELLVIVLDEKKPPSIVKIMLTVVTAPPQK